MNLLVDTHVLLWWLADDPRLSATARSAIADPANLVAVSAATVWEVSIKQALGKLDAPGDLPTVLRDGAFDPLPITVDHALLAGSLPAHHRDPFDRMLVAQAMIEDLVLVTHDEELRPYDVSLLA